MTREWKSTLAYGFGWGWLTFAIIAFVRVKFHHLPLTWTYCLSGIVIWSLGGLLYGRTMAGKRPKVSSGDSI